MGDVSPIGWHSSDRLEKQEGPGAGIGILKRAGRKVKERCNWEKEKQQRGNGIERTKSSLSAGRE